MTGTLISAADLAARLGDPNLRIADCRWYLTAPQRGRAEYDAGHIPGAIFVDLDTDLSAPSGPGRHPLPDRQVFANRMGSLGIGDGHMVIAYDDRSGAVASRLWWMLRDIGHLEVMVLDGGFAAWNAEGGRVSKAGTVSDAATVHEPTHLSVGSGPTRSVDREGVAERIGEISLLDARAPERYRGEIEPVDPVAGHIPSALNVPLTGNLGPDGRFLDPRVLADRYRPIATAGEVVVYCGSGVTACHDILAMVHAGLDEPTLYPGSWSDWSTAGMPAATGEEPG